MNTSRLILSLAPLLIAAIAHADGEAPADIARGNMSFDAKAMDTNGDGMISKDEMKEYNEIMWKDLTPSGQRTMSVADAASAFARGNLRFDAKAMDDDGDGQISQDEFMKYGDAKFDKMRKDPKGMISVSQAAQDFSRGNVRVGEGATGKGDSATPR